MNDLPDDYETCGECGYDHDYEYPQAFNAHEKMNREETSMKTFDRFDICEAAWVFTAMYHHGMFSHLYRTFGRLEKLGFKPGWHLREDPTCLSENARAWFDDMVANAGYEPFTSDEVES